MLDEKFRKAEWLRIDVFIKRNLRIKVVFSLRAQRVWSSFTVFETCFPSAVRLGAKPAIMRRAPWNAAGCRLERHVGQLHAEGRSGRRRPQDI